MIVAPWPYNECCLEGNSICVGSQPVLREKSLEALWYLWLKNLAAGGWACNDYGSESL